MVARLRAVGWIVRDAVDGFLRDDLQDRAAGLAFYTLVSLAPLVVIILILAALVADPAAVARTVEERAGSFVGPAGAEQIQAILSSAARDARGSLRLSLVSGALALLGAMTVLVQLQRALNHVWRVEPGPGLNLGPFLLKRAVSVAMMAILAVLLVASLVTSAVVAAASGWLTSVLPPWLGGATSAAVDAATSFVAFSVGFSVMFKVLPDASVAWRDAAVGGVFTGALVVVGKSAIGLYLGSSALASVYGAAGSLAVLLVWVYYDAILVLLGAELTRACAAYRASVAVTTTPAVRAPPHP